MKYLNVFATAAEVDHLKHVPRHRHVTGVPPAKGWRLAEAMRWGHTETHWQIIAAGMHGRSLQGPAEAHRVAHYRERLWQGSTIPRAERGELTFTGFLDGTTERVTIELSWVRHAHVDYERNTLRLGSIQYVGVQIIRPITKVVRTVRPDQQTVNRSE